MLTVTNLKVTNIIKNINISCEKGEITSIIGKNGSGKTTIIKSICNLIDYEGNIDIDSKEIGLIFQNPDVQFVKNIVEDDLAFGLENLNTPKEEMLKKISYYANEFDIEHLLKRNVSSLSGGEKQKIALLANLILDPKVLILDEAFEMLDARSKVKMMSFIKKIVKEKNIVCINITHDDKIINFSDNIVALHKGEVDFNLKIEEFYNSKKCLKYGFNIPLVKKISNKYNTLEELLCNLN